MWSFSLTPDRYYHCL
ncbi:hypothetical protein LINPERPRIM_LOCUS35257 [Linum perenne]